MCHLIHLGVLLHLLIPSKYVKDILFILDELHCSFHSQIDMDFVRQYQPGKTIPHVQLMIKKGKGQLTKEWIRVYLLNVHSPTSFKLVRPHSGYHRFVIIMHLYTSNFSSSYGYPCTATTAATAPQPPMQTTDVRGRLYMFFCTHSE